MRYFGLLFILLVIPCLIYGIEPGYLEYKGRITDASGVSISGTDTVAFLIYDTLEGGSPLWGETLKVEFTAGLFDAFLGGIHPIDLDFSEQYYLELSISTDGGTTWETFSPREPFLPAGYAFRVVYADTADMSVGSSGSIDPNDFVWNQDTSDQAADMRCSGVGSWAILRLVPSGQILSPQRGMLKSTYDSTNFCIFTYDGTAWRMVFPIPDSATSFGGSFSVNIGADTSICPFNVLELTAHTSGGFAPFYYDWNTDGIGDWDDSSSIEVTATNTDTFFVTVKDMDGNTATDSIIVTPSSCPYFSIDFDSDTLHQDIPAAMVYNPADKGCFLLVRTGNYSYDGDYNILLMRLDSLEMPIWSKAIIGEYGEYPSDICLTSDGGVAISGYTESYSMGGYDLFVMKFDSDGNLQWAKNIGTTKNDAGRIRVSVCQTSDGGFLVGGCTNGYDSVYSYFRAYGILVKLSSTGALQWARKIGTPYDRSDRLGGCINECEEISGGYYLISGYFAVGAYEKPFMAKLNSTGNIVWERKINYYTGDAIGIQDIWGTYLMTFSWSGTVVLRFNESGSISWARHINNNTFRSVRSIVQRSDGTYYLAGSWRNPSNSNTPAVAQISSSGTYLRTIVKGDTTRIGTGANNNGIFVRNSTELVVLNQDYYDTDPNKYNPSVNLYNFSSTVSGCDIISVTDPDSLITISWYTTFSLIDSVATSRTSVVDVTSNFTVRDVDIRRKVVCP